MNALTTQALQAAVPAAFSNQHNMSDRYSQVRTADLLDRLGSEGWLPVDAKQDNPLRRNRLTVTHRITLQHAESRGENLPQIHLVNSHNGRTKLRIFAGLFRLICTNGLIVSEGGMDFRFEARHSGNVLDQSLAFALQAGEHPGEVSRVVEDWQRRELTKLAAHSFARKAARLRFGDSADAYDADDLLRARRGEDEGLSLWKVFNRVQENTVKGGLSGENASGRKVTSRALTAVQPEIRYNADLWALAASYN